MAAGDQQLAHTTFVPEGYWSPCTSMVWDPIKAPDSRFSSSHFHLEDVKTFTYLDNIIDEQGGSDADVKARIGKVKAAY
ncbi:unnamed protein product [Schistosoma margrebowiei]|uniref:Uncharacterized protein n=1 Tax=Schistosoma margrebowiei TaxID=48269 RepID=A0A183MU94_9TREM|nr:unnamed protein product [Schistosoma margrebowiei]